MSRANGNPSIRNTSAYPQIERAPAANPTSRTHKWYIPTGIPMKMRQEKDEPLAHVEIHSMADLKTSIIIRG